MRAKRVTRGSSRVLDRERIAIPSGSKVLTACLLVMVFLWTANAILSAWRLEIGRNQGYSMSPTFGDGAIYMTRVRPPEIRVGDVVEARIAVGVSINRVVKRVIRVEGSNVLLEGDNKNDTWRGWVPVSSIEAKVVAVVWRGHSPPMPLSVQRPPPKKRTMLMVH